jgi:hypothetical protein
MPIALDDSSEEEQIYAEEEEVEEEEASSEHSAGEVEYMDVEEGGAYQGEYKAESEEESSYESSAKPDEEMNEGVSEEEATDMSSPPRIARHNELAQFAESPGERTRGSEQSEAFSSPAKDARSTAGTMASPAGMAAASDAAIEHGPSLSVEKPEEIPLVHRTEVTLVTGAADVGQSTTQADTSVLHESASYTEAGYEAEESQGHATEEDEERPKEHVGIPPCSSQAETSVDDSHDRAPEALGVEAEVVPEPRASAQVDAGYDGEISQCATDIESKLPRKRRREDEGYDGEDEEVSESQPTDQEDEGTRRRVQLYLPQETEAVREPQKPRKTADNPTLSDMDAADEQTTEHDDDLGAESSELEDTVVTGGSPEKVHALDVTGASPGGASLQDYAAAAQKSMPVPQWQEAEGLSPARGEATVATDMSLPENRSVAASIESAEEEDDFGKPVVVDHVPTAEASSAGRAVAPLPGTGPAEQEAGTGKTEEEIVEEAQGDDDAEKKPAAVDSGQEESDASAATPRRGSRARRHRESLDSEATQTGKTVDISQASPGMSSIGDRSVVPSAGISEQGLSEQIRAYLSPRSSIERSGKIVIEGDSESGADEDQVEEETKSSDEEPEVESKPAEEDDEELARSSKSRARASSESVVRRSTRLHPIAENKPVEEEEPAEDEEPAEELTPATGQLRAVFRQRTVAVRMVSRQREDLDRKRRAVPETSSTPARHKRGDSASSAGSPPSRGVTTRSKSSSVPTTPEGRPPRPTRSIKKKAETPAVEAASETPLRRSQRTRKLSPKKKEGEAAPETPLRRSSPKAPVKSSDKKKAEVPADEVAETPLRRSKRTPAKSPAKKKARSPSTRSTRSTPSRRETRSHPGGYDLRSRGSTSPATATSETSGGGNTPRRSKCRKK